MAKTRWLVALAVLCLVVAVAAVAYAAGKAKPAVPVQEVVRAKRFELVDAKGRVRATLEFGAYYWPKAGAPGETKEQLEKEGVPRLMMFDERGTKRAELTVDRHGSWLGLSRETGKPGAILSASFRSNGLGVFDNEGKRKVLVEAGEVWPSMTYQHGVVLFGGDDEQTATLVTDAEGEPHLSLSAPGGGKWSAP